MSDTLVHLMERNLLEVFGQRNSARRTAAITELYTADCTFSRRRGRSTAENTQRKGRNSSVRLKLE